MQLPLHVKVVEVGPRDGLQNEPQLLNTATKVEFIHRLAATGLTVIEATSMVNPAWVPQLADAERLYAQLQPTPGVRYPVLIPNLQGLERALAVGVCDIAVFIAASERFSQKNTHCSIDQSLERVAAVMARAQALRLRVRGYISCVLGCPYEGEIKPHRVAVLAEQLYKLGCSELSLGDTIGVGTPVAAQQLVLEVAGRVPLEAIAVHFHDTRGQALANILATLQVGVTTVDSAVAGLGGCPYAQGASGNVATEDVIYMLHGMGITTGVDLPALIEVGRFICAKLERTNQSKVGRA